MRRKTYPSSLVLTLALAVLVTAVAPVAGQTRQEHDGQSLSRMFPRMKFAKGTQQCLRHLLPYLAYLRRQERRLDKTAGKLGITPSTRWQEARIHWRKRGEIWTRASYCWPCFDRSDLARDWREALADRKTADDARRKAEAALARMETGSVVYLYADLARANAGADQMHATARRGFFGCLLGKNKPGG